MSHPFLSVPDSSVDGLRFRVDVNGRPVETGSTDCRDTEVKWWTF